MVTAAFPFIEVTIDTSALAPVAQRAPGVIAVVGASDAGSAPVNSPREVGDLAEAAALFASRDADGSVIPTPLFQSLAVAFAQDARPSKFYGVKVTADGHGAGLTALEGIDDITFVSLAGVTAIGTASTATAAATGLHQLKEHVEHTSAAGHRRIGVAMVDPARQRAADYVDGVITDYVPLRSDNSRMVLVAARGAVGDVATAAMAAAAALPPHVSLLLKKIRGVSMPLESQYSATEIRGLSEANIIPIIDPTLVPGPGLHFGEGRTFTTDESRLYVDTVRTLDDIESRLKAGLIGLVGDARITKSGMVRLKTRIEGILEPLLRAEVIAGFEVAIPVLDVLSLPESVWTAGDRNQVETARANRIVDLQVSVTYGPAVHRLNVTLAMKF
jgi:hypothetical protein